MSENSLEEAEFEQSLNNFEAPEEVEFYMEYLENEIQKLKVDKFRLKIDSLASEQDTIESDRDKVIAQMKEDGSMIEYVGSEFQNDYNVVLEAVKTFEWALCYASKELQNEYEIVFQALQVNPNALEYASDELKTQDEFIKIYINHWVGEYKVYKTIDEFIQLHELVIDRDLVIVSNYVLHKG